MISEDQLLVGSYYPPLVVLSAAVALIGSYTALDLGGRVTAASAGRRLAWLIGGAIAMGTGIWSMHFIAMLAFRLPVPVLYDWPTVLLSLLPAVLSSLVALFVVSRQTMGPLQAITGSLFQGAGIVAMHYIAMDAMRLQGMCHYSPPVVALSVLLAVVGALLSLWLTFQLRHEARGRRMRKAGGAVLMGGAICSMHYTGMAAVTFIRSDTIPDLSRAISITTIGAIGIAAVTVMVLVVALLTSFADQLDKERALFSNLFHQSPQAVALTDSDNRVSLLNDDFTQTFGYLPQDAVGRHLDELIVPPDGDAAFERYTPETQDGRRMVAEGVRRRKDGSLLHALMVRVPVHMPGGEFASYSIYQDITDRKEAENAVRSLSGRILKVADEERRNIARELHDSTAQLLAALSLNISVANDEAQYVDPRIRRALEESAELTDQCLREIRTVSYLLHPPELDELGLETALTRYIDGFAQRSGIRVEIRLSPRIGRLSREVDTAIFRIVQECLTNIHRHSGSRTASVTLDRRGTELTLEVKDSGEGVRRESSAGVGIASMRERAAQLGGELHIFSDSSGTTVRALIPLSGSVA